MFNHVTAGQTTPHAAIQSGNPFNPKHLMRFIDEIDADRVRGLSSGDMEEGVHQNVLNQLMQLRSKVREAIGDGALSHDAWASTWSHALATQAMIEGNGKRAAIEAGREEFRAIKYAA